MAERRSPDPAAERQAQRQSQGHHGMALGWLKRGRVKQAIISLEKALALDPGYLDAYLELGRILLHLRRWRDLVALCQRGLKYHLEVPELHKLMITALTERGSLDDADACYGLERRDQRCIDIGPDEILCCVAIRNERQRLPYFLDYYRRLGVDRFLFIDNDSSDGSPDWLLQQPDVHLWHSALSFKRANFGSAWFELLLRRYGIGHWCLSVDADEFLLFEGAPKRSLKAFCADLDRRGHRGATGMLLDMYSDRPIHQTVYREGSDPLALCHYFDREFCHRRYDNGGQYRNQTILFGGVRQRVFPAENDYLLSKAVLLRYAPDRVLTSGQHLTNIPAHQLAEMQICLLHYKFFASFTDYARDEAAREVHAMAGEQYKAYYRELSRGSDLLLYDSELSLRFEGTEQLRRLGVMQPEPASTAGIPVIEPAYDSESDAPFWSVMITVHDRVSNLEQVVSSVLAATNGAELGTLQIEVVCDAPTPALRDAAEAEVARVGAGRVEFHALPTPAGHPDVFNHCLGRARGEWVHILHDDDWVEPGFYSGLRRLIESEPAAGAAFCQHRIVASGGHQPVVWDSWVERETPGLIDDWLERIAIECRVQFSAMTVRREVYRQLGGFCAAARSAFDWEMWARIATGYRVAYLPEVLVGVGRDDSALSSGLLRSGDQVRDAFAAIEMIARSLPAERVDSLSAKARARIAAYALDVARQYLEGDDLSAALANLRAAVAVNPDQETLRRLTEVLQGADHAYRG